MATRKSSFMGDLADLAIYRSAGMRPALARVLTDLFVSKARAHTRDEIDDFGELLANLLDGLDARSRMLIAEKLAPRRDAPPPLIARLATDAAAVAAPLLSRSPLLDEAFLMRVIEAGEPARLRAIAARDDLTPALATALGAAGIAKLEPQPEVQPPPPPAAPASAVSNGFMPFLAAERLARQSAVLALIAAPPPAKARLTPTALSGDIGRSLADHALNGRRPAFAAMLCELLSLEPDLGQRIIDDEGGEPLMIALRALGVDEAPLLTCLLHATPPSVGHAYFVLKDVQALGCALAPEAASALLRGGFVRGARTGHMPYLAEAKPRASKTALRHGGEVAAETPIRAKR